MITWFQGHLSQLKPAVGAAYFMLPEWNTVQPLQPTIWITSHLDYSPNLFCIVDFNLRPLLDKFGVLLQILYPPLRMLLQVVKLILQKKKTTL